MSRHPSKPVSQWEAAGPALGSAALTALLRDWCPHHPSPSDNVPILTRAR